MLAFASGASSARPVTTILPVVERGAVLRLARACRSGSAGRRSGRPRSCRWPGSRPAGPRVSKAIAVNRQLPPVGRVIGGSDQVVRRSPLGVPRVASRIGDGCRHACRWPAGSGRCPGPAARPARSSTPMSSVAVPARLTVSDSSVGADEGHRRVRRAGHRRTGVDGQPALVGRRRGLVLVVGGPHREAVACPARG